MTVSALTSLQQALDSLPPNDDWGVEAARMLLDAAGDFAASDLHITPSRNGLTARARVHGSLVTLAVLPVARGPLLVSRLKVMAHLPSYKRGEPQDGRIECEGPAGRIVLRAAFLPMLHGEGVVVRFPAEGRALDTLEALGMPASIRSAAELLITQPEGTVVATGPSGSGKTTTLYAMLRLLRTPNIKT